MSCLYNRGRLASATNTISGDLCLTGTGPPMSTHRPLSSSFLGLPFRILYKAQKELRSISLIRNGCSFPRLWIFLIRVCMAIRNFPLSRVRKLYDRAKNFKNTQNGESECNLRRKGFLHAQTAAGLCILYAKTLKTENRSTICVGRVSFMRKMQPDCAFCTQKHSKQRIGVQFA